MVNFVLYVFCHSLKKKKKKQFFSKCGLKAAVEASPKSLLEMQIQPQTVSKAGHRCAYD